ncbi:MAG: FAD-dependent oxidoreductase [Gemmataceae bacterium]
MSSADCPFTIVGAGLAGGLLACHLGKAGRRVHLYEERPDPRSTEIDQGRSINLAISVRGIHALRQVGLADDVLARAIPMRGRMMHDRHGQLTFQPYGKDDSESIHSVSRGELNRLLIEAADRFDTVSLTFERKCTGVDLHERTIELADRAGKHESIEAACLIGSDGAYSAVRAQLQKLERFDFAQAYLSHGYKELTMPAAAGGTHAMEKHALHIWPRQSFMMIALPNLDGSFTCTLFWPFEGPNSFASIKDEKDLLALFQREFPDVLPLMPGLAADYFGNPTGALVTVRCAPWHVEDKVVLLGDAAHAVVPFLGQGMNAAFEDCTVLADCLAQAPHDRAAAFRAYQARRKVHTDVLADLCVDNFLEMRDKVGSKWFVLRKKLDVFLHRLLPGIYEPLYTLVTFTRTPYADALRRARIQEAILRGSAGLLLLVILLLLFTPW